MVDTSASAVALAFHFRDVPDCVDRARLCLCSRRASRRASTINGREGTDGQGPLCRGVPRLRRLHPGAQPQTSTPTRTAGVTPAAVVRRWTPEIVREAMWEWRERYGRPVVV